MIKVWAQGDVSGNTIPIARRALFTEIHGLLRHMPSIRRFLRLVLNESVTGEILLESQIPPFFSQESLMQPSGL